MKIIISSKELKKKLKTVVECQPSKVVVENDTIYFLNNELPCEKIELSHTDDVEDFNVYYDVFQWKKLYKYLKLLPHQPITLLLRYNTETSLIIEAIGEARFKPTKIKRH